MIINRQKKVRIQENGLARFLGRIRRELKLPAAKMTVCFVSDSEIAKLNKQFRAKPKPTDVLSFPARSLIRGRAAKNGNAPVDVPQNFLGDIAISPETAHRNAKKYGRTLEEELRILMLHGTLHLLGYDHEVDRGEMERLEMRLRRRLRLA